jgi:hypothetical protein
VKKQSQRALEKLSRILRSKGVTLSATLIATGLTSELAKAAPPAFLHSATTAVLTGSATYSTTGLTLMFATKSKALIPIIVLICAVPLAIQQVAISRAVSRIERLNSDMAANGSTAKHSPPSRGSTDLVTSTPSGRISIAALSRALDDARSSSLNYLNFQKTIESLTPDELVELIPEAIHLPEARRKKAELLEFLMRALAKTDPGQAVRITLSADPRGEVAMLARLPDAFSAWTLKDPDAAFAFFQQLYANREFNPLTEGGFPWSHNITTLVNEFVKSLVAVGSPHVRDVIFMTPESNRSNTFFNSIGKASGSSYLHDNGAPSDLSPQNFANFLPLIREFVPEQEHKQAFDRLVSEVSPFSKDFDRILGEFADRSELLPAERSLLAASYAHSKIGTYYNTTPHPDRVAVEAAARQWLELHVPDEAGAIFEKAKADTYVQEMGQIKRRIESIARNPDLTDSELVQELGSKVYGEMLPQALEQAARIKDPAKRAEVIHRLQNP